jgi:hypothetical protein
MKFSIKTENIQENVLIKTKSLLLMFSLGNLNAIVMLYPLNSIKLKHPGCFKHELSNERKNFFECVDIMSVSSPKFATCITGYYSSSQYVSEAL